jgi:NAD(P)-dependent dehydrogenase (short-subunit alcohol dehydrogenase family)
MNERAYRLAGRVVMVTGGSTGIGRAAAERCAADGAKVVIADVNVDESAAAVAGIVAAGGVATHLRTDVGCAVSVRSCVEEIVLRYGRLDGAFNNAGVEGGFTSLARVDEAVFDRTIAVNLKGVFLCLKYQILQMLAQGGGAIVNNASAAGLVGVGGGVAYCASKHGVVGMTKVAALDYARKGIRVNAVCPGMVRTPMLERLAGSPERLLEYGEAQPVGRIAEPRELGDAVAWLLSDEASFVTGAALPVDGGWTAR